VPNRDGSRACVTGGSGFIGRALVRRLVADGWSVRALARSDTSAATVEGAGAEAEAEQAVRDANGERLEVTIDITRARTELGVGQWSAGMKARSGWARRAR